MCQFLFHSSVSGQTYLLAALLRCAASLRQQGRFVVNLCAGLKPRSSTGRAEATARKSSSKFRVSGFKSKAQTKKMHRFFAFKKQKLRSHPRRAIRVGDPGAQND